jgi:hypothetical protein
MLALTRIDFSDLQKRLDEATTMAEIMDVHREMWNRFSEWDADFQGSLAEIRENLNPVIPKRGAKALEAALDAWGPPPAPKPRPNLTLVKGAKDE